MKFQRICAYPNCQEVAEYPAPRSPHEIKQRIYFCLDHVKAYNKKWNGLEGFTGDEIFNMQMGSYWNRPTWAMGVGSRSNKSANTADFMDDPFRMFDVAESTSQPKKTKKRAKKINLNTLPGQIRAACETLGTESPTDISSIKLAYRQLAKRYHPDVNKDLENAMERIKRINEAYKTLVRYAEKNG